ncbi:GTP-binding protein, partial [Helicobacter pylori]
MENNENHEKLNGIVNELYDNIEKTTQIPMMNVLLMGATGVGKSSLINALFGKEIAKAGVGK